MRMSQIQTILNQEQAIAVDALKDGNKARALTALRRRKYQEGLLQKTDGQLEVLENLVCQGYPCASHLSPPKRIT